MGVATFWQNLNEMTSISTLLRVSQPEGKVRERNGAQELTQSDFGS